MKKIYIPFFALIIIFNNALAQQKSKKELKGDKYAFKYSYVRAIEYYVHTKHLTIEGQRRLAESYHKLSQNIQSERVYSKIINEQNGILPEDYYNYAMVLKINGKYDESNKWMSKFSELKPNDLRVKDFIANKAELPNLLKDTGKYKIEYLSINSNAEDFGPTYFKNNIVFASTRSTTKMIKRNYNWTGKPFWDMYISEVNQGQLSAPQNFDKRLNGKLHDGPASFSKNGTFMAFTRNNYHDKSKDKVVELQIFFSSFKDNTWSEPIPFKYNNPSYSVGQPCLSSDGNIMYFTSDMPGGFGGADIYRSTKDSSGVWSKPENLGDKINTEGDEMYPFFEDKTKVLFFTSNGRFGLGGLDIFKCRMNGTGFTRVYNAGAPLNTQYDDFAVIANDDLSKGYFTSNRKGVSTGDDIYSVEFVKEPEPNVLFAVKAPKIIPIERKVREFFPLRNYVFFNEENTEMPDRYIMLTKEQMKSFKDDNLGGVELNKISSRSKRQMIVYYNILNILGDRLVKNPTANIIVVGSSKKGIEDGKAMAESVKKYLLKITGINTSRIKLEARLTPKIPSEQEGGTRELELLREEDRRVSIESNSPILLMEFQSGADTPPLKPVEIMGVQDTPLDSYVSFLVDGGKDTISSWTLEIMDDKEKIQHFGPYSEKKISIPGKTILGVNTESEFNITMKGITKNGIAMKKDTSIHLKLWTPPQNEEMMRYSIIFEFNDSKAISIYERYLSEIVIPKIPHGAKVIISGYTDKIGEELYNQKLSMARANEVYTIIKDGLSKTGRNDVVFDVYGFGEDITLTPFANKYPEERFYNRTVIIDIIPQ